MTLVQVQDILFRPRDKQGNIRRDKLPELKTPRQEFIERWKKWGVSEERAAELWREKERKAREKARARRKPRKKEELKRRGKRPS